ncbi:MAG: endonuclease III [Actinobacteria bacterium]|nr:endonuclease III [Actinomycetota bacterium]
MPATRLTRRHGSKKRAPIILEALRAEYPEARIALRFSNPLECVVPTILSAQSTDSNVNQVTRRLFAKYRSPEDYLRVPESELQDDIRPTGFFNQKTRALRAMSEVLMRDYGGEVPRTMAELVKLPGVARKTANVVQGNCFPDQALHDPDSGIAVDTHVGRVSVRLDLTGAGSKDAVAVERDLMALLPPESWRDVTYLFIEHGRRICDAKTPRCAECRIEELCPSSQVAGRPDLYRRRLRP